MGWPSSFACYPHGRESPALELYLAAIIDFVKREQLDCTDGLLLSRGTDEVTNKLCSFLEVTHRRGYNAQGVMDQLRPTIRSIVSKQIRWLQEDRVRTPGDEPNSLVLLLSRAH